MRALSLVGRPYRWGGASYEGGFDCSGFVQAVYRDGMGVRLPRNAAQQAAATVPIERRSLASGDLVFFNTLGHSYSHVGIYVGDGRFVHSPKAGGSIRLESMSKMYWETRFDGARRVVR
jgi:cell wall-associated NlpC family hydrolase